MKKALVDIFSDQTNAAIMRHPDRQFPGLLLQGDTLYGLCREVDELCQMLDPAEAAFLAANDFRNRLWSLLIHYKNVLTEHEMGLPFNEGG